MSNPEKENISALKGKLARAFAGALIAGSNITVAVAQETASSPQTPQAAQTAKTPASLNEIANYLILQAAKSEADTLMPLGRTGYSDRLDQLAADYAVLHKAVFDGENDASKLVVMDPSVVAVGLALKLDKADISRKLLAKAGITLEDEALISLISRQKKPFTTPLWSSYTTEASALPPYIVAGLKDCVVTPMTPYGLFTARKIGGFDQKTQVRMINNHEKWHCMHRTFTLQTAGFTRETTFAEAFLTEVRGESFADLGMAGDEIRSGKNPENVFHAVIRTRAGNSHILHDGKHMGGDYTHLSVPALEGLQTFVGEKGIEYFQKMTPKELVELYTRLSVQYTPDAEKIFKMSLYLRGQLTEGHHTTAAEYAGIALAQKVLSYQPAPLTMIGPAGNPLYAEIKAEIEAFDPKHALETTAIARDGHISPRSLIQAHATLQSQYHEQMQQDDSLLYQAASAKLQAAFVNYVSIADYVAANARHGVDVAKVPVLSSFLAQAEKLYATGFILPAQTIETEIVAMPADHSSAACAHDHATPSFTTPYRR